MPIYNGGAGSWHSLAPYVGAGGTWRKLSDVWVGTGGVWKKIYSAAVFSVSTSPKSVTGVSTAKKNGTTPPVTATPLNATGAVTYAWSRLPGGTGDTFVNSPSSVTTTFHGSINQDTDSQDTWIVTATDSGGHSAVAQVTVTVVGGFN